MNAGEDFGSRDDLPEVEGASAPSTAQAIQSVEQAL